MRFATRLARTILATAAFALLAHPAQGATIEIDAYPGTDFVGHIQSVGAGTGSEFAILPAQNANGNWVKVTQRVPVRIAFDGNPGKPLIAGLSSTVTVHLGD